MSGTSSLTITGLTKRFGSNMAVHPLDLRVEGGEVFGLLGPNGAGKTTLIRMICGFTPPDGGNVRYSEEACEGPASLFNNEDVAQKQPRPSRDLRHSIGVCPQEIVLWEQLTCIEQLVFIAGMYGIRAKTAYSRGMELLESLQLEDRAHQRAVTLSGGMKRRLNLLLALVHDPAIVLLDEPEAGLDPQSRVLVRDFIRGLARRKTVILTSHNMDEVDRVADRVGIMNEGRLLIVDTPAAIKNHNGSGDVLQISIDTRADDLVAAGLTALKSLPAKMPFTIETAPGLFAVRGPHVVDAVADCVNALRGLGIPISSLSIRENTLEDAFISLTGRSLSNESAETIS